VTGVNPHRWLSRQLLQRCSCTSSSNSSSGRSNAAVLHAQSARSTVCAPTSRASPTLTVDKRSRRRTTDGVYQLSAHPVVLSSPSPTSSVCLVNVSQLPKQLNVRTNFDHFAAHFLQDFLRVCRLISAPCDYAVIATDLSLSAVFVVSSGWSRSGHLS